MKFAVRSKSGVHWHASECMAHPVKDRINVCFILRKYTRMPIQTLLPEAVSLIDGQDCSVGLQECNFSNVPAIRKSNNSVN